MRSPNDPTTTESHRCCGVALVDIETPLTGQQACPAYGSDQPAEGGGRKSLEEIATEHVGWRQRPS
jgi:hypothetical protein